MTKAHNDRITQNGEDHGYSIRVGKNVPNNAANLAYVYTPAVAPKENLIITDVSSQIVENRPRDHSESERMVYPDESFLLRDTSGVSTIPSKSILVTDEFSVPTTTQDRPAPLYYKVELRGLFDGKLASVAYNKGGYSDVPPAQIIDYTEVDKSRLDGGETLLYLGNKIRITYADGTTLDASKHYKVILMKEEGTGIPKDAFRVMIYTNFRGSQTESYLVRYEKYNLDGTHIGDAVEILNAQPFFTSVPKETWDTLTAAPKNPDGTWKTQLFDKQYALVETSNLDYKVYAPSQVVVADSRVRPAQQFRYRITANLTTKLNENNKGTLKVGIAYLNNAIYGVEDLTSVVKRLYEHEAKPPYLDFVNPHPLNSDKKEDGNPAYWALDLDMAKDHYLDYDLIILTGYGRYDMARHNDSLRAFLEVGGKLWIDNGGTADQLLALDNLFTNISFSTTQVNLPKVFGPSLEAKKFFERLYLIPQENLSIGYTGINPKIVLGDGEDASWWQTIVQYDAVTPSVISRTAFDKGTIIVSNCGIFRAVHSSETDDIRIAMNAILSYAEERWIHTPWIQEYVYHRDNLFVEEYKTNGVSSYIDDRNDLDSSQIVAKKILNKSLREAIIPYVDTSYYKADGTFNVECLSDLGVTIANNDFEVGAYNETTGQPITQWTDTSAITIPGWSTHVLSGVSATFEHSSTASERGNRAIKIDVPTATIGSTAYWATPVNTLMAGSYKISGWIKAVNAGGLSTAGATVGIFTQGGTQIAIGAPVIGTRDWVKVEVSFSLQTMGDIEVRLGFVNGNGVGTIYFDHMEMVSIGSVYMTPQNDGSRPLYAYAVRPLGEVFDLQAQGFTRADVTTYDPILSLTYTIRALVYSWDSVRGAYKITYGNYKTYTTNIRRSDGYINLGLLTTLVPPLNSGGDWADKSRIRFEVFLGTPGGSDWSSQFVNIGFFNTKSGRYYYAQDGQNILSYDDIYADGLSEDIIVQAWTSYYTIRATKRRYAVRLKNDDRIYLEYPNTIDDRGCWFPRVNNGVFSKVALSRQEVRDHNRYYTSSSFTSRNPVTDQVTTQVVHRQYGVHHYTLPEYMRQTFKPGIPYRRVREELCEYVDERTIRVQNAPLHIQSGQARGETTQKMDGATNKIYKAIYNEWSKSFTPVVYVNGLVQTAQAYDIDYKNGLVIFSSNLQNADIVKVDYDYNNITLFKRSYLNSKVKREQMTSADNRTFKAINPNWTAFPIPVVYRLPYGEENIGAFIASVDTYTLDHETGTIQFEEEVNDRVYVDYTYSLNQSLSIRDYDIQAGLLFLDTPITFKDEVYASYYYEENFVEYRGYYDEILQRFMSLDLNPSEGHTCTMPVLRTPKGAETFQALLTIEEVPTAKLMNKEVYLYILPASNSFGDQNEYAIRHCFSKEEWAQIQKAKPTALLLGIIQLREHTTVEDAIVLDARVRGGGLKDAVTSEQIKRVQPNSTSYWDLGSWDGMAYYSNGVVVFELPKTILQANGGQFTEKQVTDIVRKYIAYGIYFIVEYV